MSYLPSQSGGGPQLPSYIHEDGGGTPGAGGFTTDNDDPTATTKLFFYTSFTPTVTIGSFLTVVQGLAVYVYLVTGRAAGDTEIDVVFQASLITPANFSGTFYFSIAPFQIPVANIQGVVPSTSGGAGAVAGLMFANGSGGVTQATAAQILAAMGMPAQTPSGFQIWFGTLGFTADPAGLVSFFNTFGITPAADGDSNPVLDIATTAGIVTTRA